MKTAVLVLLVIAGMLAVTNPSETDYRAHIQERQGIVGTLSLGLADLLSKNSSKGIHRDNYLVCSKFFVGGDGILPRQDLAWGVAGKFFDVAVEKER